MHQSRKNVSAIDSRMNEYIVSWSNKGMPLSKENLQLYTAMQVSLTNNAEQKQQDTEEYVLCDSMPMNLKSRQNWFWSQSQNRD